MKKSVSILPSFLFFFVSVTKSQIFNDNKFSIKELNGYYILYRDSIPTSTNSDVVLPTYAFTIYYVKTIDIYALNSLRQFGRPSNDSIVFLSSGVDYDIAISDDHKAFINWLKENNYIEKLNNYSIFDYDKTVLDLINTSKRFAAIYKGKCNVVGPFIPSTKLNLKREELFKYLPVKDNKIEYLFCVIL